MTISIMSRMDSFEEMSLHCEGNCRLDHGLDVARPSTSYTKAHVYFCELKQEAPHGVLWMALGSSSLPWCITFFTMGGVGMFSDVGLACFPISGQHAPFSANFI